MLIFYFVSVSFLGQCCVRNFLLRLLLLTGVLLRIKFLKVEANLKKTMDGELYLIEEYEDDTPPDIIPENGEEPPKKILRRRKVRFCCTKAAVSDRGFFRLK